MKKRLLVAIRRSLSMSSPASELEKESPDSMGFFTGRFQREESRRQAVRLEGTQFLRTATGARAVQPSGMSTSWECSMEQIEDVCWSIRQPLMPFSRRRESPSITRMFSGVEGARSSLPRYPLPSTTRGTRSTRQEVLQEDEEARESLIHCAPLATWNGIGLKSASLRSGLAEEALRVAARIQRGCVARWSWIWMFIHFYLAPCQTEFGQQ